MEVIARSRQSLLDIAIQECGSLETVFALSLRNDIALSDVLVPGQVIEVATEDIVRKQVVAALALFGAKPASELDVSKS